MAKVIFLLLLLWNLIPLLLCLVTWIGSLLEPHSIVPLLSATISQFLREILKNLTLPNSLSMFPKIYKISCSQEKSWSLRNKEMITNLLLILDILINRLFLLLWSRPIDSILVAEASREISKKHWGCIWS